MKLTYYDEDRLDGDDPDFLAAMNAGDLKTAIAMLRSLPSLDAAQIAELADILSDDPALAPNHPYAVKLVLRTRGKPIDRQRDRMTDYMTHIVVGLHMENAGKMEAALQATADDYGISVAAVKARIRRYKRRRKAIGDLSNPSSS